MAGTYTLEELSERLDVLTKQFSQHLGSQPGAVVSLMPHPGLSAAQAGAYVVTNATPTRSMNVSGVTATQVANELAQLIADLQSVKIIA